MSVPYVNAHMYYTTVLKVTYLVKKEVGGVELSWHWQSELVKFCFLIEASFEKTHKRIESEKLVEQLYMSLSFVKRMGNKSTIQKSKPRRSRKFFYGKRKEGSWNDMGMWMFTLILTEKAWWWNINENRLDSWLEYPLPLCACECSYMDVIIISKVSVHYFTGVRFIHVYVCTAYSDTKILQH